MQIYVCTLLIIYPLFFILFCFDSKNIYNASWMMRCIRDINFILAVLLVCGICDSHSAFELSQFEGCRANTCVDRQARQPAVGEIYSSQVQRSAYLLQVIDPQNTCTCTQHKIFTLPILYFWHLPFDWILGSLDSLHHDNHSTTKFFDGTTICTVDIHHRFIDTT